MSANRDVISYGRLRAVPGHNLFRQYFHRWTQAEIHDTFTASGIHIEYTNQTKHFSHCPASCHISGDSETTCHPQSTSVRGMTCGKYVLR